MLLDHLPPVTPIPANHPALRAKRFSAAFSERRWAERPRRRSFAASSCYNAKNKKPGQHQGPITPAFQRVLSALLWKFHNSRTGFCFPSYETIAVAARCCRDTVYEAIRALEAADILTWVNRFDKIRTQCIGAFGRAFTRWQVYAPATPTAFAILCHAQRSTTHICRKIPLEP